jgi:hypothetical protein
VKPTLNLRVLRALSPRVAKIIGHPLFPALFFGTLIRFLLAPFTEQRWDNYVYRLMGAYVFGYGINPLFPERGCSCLPILNYSYPPVWLSVILPLFRFWQLTTGFQFSGSADSLWAAGISSNNIFQAYRSFVPPNLPLLDLLFKTPIILADAGIGYLIWLLGGKSRRVVRLSLLGWMLNPYAITISAVWGEFDSIAILFLLLSIYYLTKNKISWSGFWLGLGASTKIFPALILPGVLIFLLFNQRGQVPKYLVIFSATTAAAFSSLIIFPYPLEYIGRLLTGRAAPNFNGVTQFTGLSWMIVFNALSPQPQLPFFLILLPVTLGAVLAMYWKKVNANSLLGLFAASLLCFYLSYPIVNVQYALWPIPLLSILAAKGRIRNIVLAGFSAIPAIMLYTSSNLIYMISPALIFDENNYPPATDVVQQLWNFPSALFVALPLVFVALVIVTVRTLTRSSWDADAYGSEARSRGRE